MKSLRALVEEFRARGLSDYSRGRADRHDVWSEAASLLEERLDDVEDEWPPR